MTALERLAHLLGFDPFTYLIVTIAGIAVWTWCTVIGDFALTGRGVWLRWGRWPWPVSARCCSPIPPACCTDHGL
jgi:hypothetical protein